jgi:hypothetical protein
VTVAEESGLIVPIGEVVLDEACRQLSAWRAELGANAPVMISVNLSIAQVRTDDLIDRVRTALAEHDLRPSQLELELDERILLTEDPAVQRRLADLRALGVRLAIDDFGSGYASLSALRRLHVDTGRGRPGLGRGPHRSCPGPHAHLRDGPARAEPRPPDRRRGHRDRRAAPAPAPAALPARPGCPPGSAPRPGRDRPAAGRRPLQPGPATAAVGD